MGWCVWWVGPGGRPASWVNSVGHASAQKALKSRGNRGEKRGEELVEREVHKPHIPWLPPASLPWVEIRDRGSKFQRLPHNRRQEGG